MEFFCYHRDRPGSAALRDELLEQHWAYMDQYAKEMIARGPTFADDGTPTGSVHIADLPDPVAARAFAFDEPNYQAGAYRDVLLRRWRNTLGRTMWDFPGGRTGGNRYLVLGLGMGQAADLAMPPGQDGLIAYGPLLSDDGTTSIKWSRSTNPLVGSVVIATETTNSSNKRSSPYGRPPPRAAFSPGRITPCTRPGHVHPSEVALFPDTPINRRSELQRYLIVLREWPVGGSVKIIGVPPGS